MRSATLPPTADSRRAPVSRRVIAFVLAIVAHILIVILLLRLAPAPTPPRVVERRPAAFQLLPEPEVEKPAPENRTIARTKSTSGGASPRAPKATSDAATSPKPPQAPPTPPPAVLLPGGMELFDAADISKMHAHPGENEVAGGDTDGAGSGKNSGSAYGPGEGPGGERLYNAEWYREPSHAELNGYLPAGAPPGGWALIACKTIEDNRVENCRSLGESPAGSGLARAVRQAAWQFRIRPPRIGGRRIIGAWVRIRIDWDTGQVN